MLDRRFEHDPVECRALCPLRASPGVPWAPLHRHPDTFTLQMRLFCLQVAKAKTDLKKKGEKMPMFYTGAWTKGAGVTFPTCSSTGDYFMDFSKCFSKSSLGKGRWGHSCPVPLACTAACQPPPDSLTQCTFKMCQAPQEGLLKHVWTHLSHQRNLFFLCDIQLPSP